MINKYAELIVKKGVNLQKGHGRFTVFIDRSVLFGSTKPFFCQIKIFIFTYFIVLS